MVKNNIKDRKAAKLAAEKQADIKLYRLMVQFALAAVALFLVLTVKNNEIFVLGKIMPIFLVVSGVLFGLSAVLFCVKHAKGTNESERIITSAGIFGNAASLFFVSCAYYLFMEAELVIAALIALAVVYMAYNINGAGFFAYSVLTAASYLAFSLSCCEVMFPIASVIVNASFVLSFAVPVLAIAAAVLVLAKKDGINVLGVKISGKLIALALIVTALVALAAAAVAIVYPAAAQLIMYAMLAVYFLATVVGIFKMM